MIARNKFYATTNCPVATLKINCSVPQGSILGPLLFLICVNDFSSCITKGKTTMFADDTNLFFSENCNERVFQGANVELKSVDNWLTANKLSLNINKTNCIVFRVANSLMNILFNCEKKVSRESLL